jgi:hypothetical protein
VPLKRPCMRVAERDARRPATHRRDLSLREYTTWPSLVEASQSARCLGGLRRGGADAHGTHVPAWRSMIMRSPVPYP